MVTNLVRSFLAAEAGLFVTAALVHAGVLFKGYEHTEAATAESVIAAVLVAGLVATGIAPASSRGIGLGAQGFALVGTFIGLLTIALGVGPRTAFDLVLHGLMIALLVTGWMRVSRQTLVGSGH